MVDPPAVKETPKNDMPGFQSFDNVASDAVLAIEFNTTGNRLATTSADHRLRIYDVNEDGQISTVEQWRAHDAEIIDVHWVDARLGQFLGTIGGDNKFKLWREDPFQAPNSGRRFKCIFSQSPFNGTSYVCFEFLTRGTDIWLGLLTQDGLLSLLEPAEPDSLSSWKEVDQFYPFGKHTRGHEPKLDLSFQQSLAPNSENLFAGLDPGAILLAVSAAAAIKLFCAVKPTEEGNYHFQEVLEIETTAGGVQGASFTTINQVAWAPGPLKSYDVIAAACEDSTVRVFDVHVSTAISHHRSASSSSSTRHRYTTSRTPSSLSATAAASPPKSRKSHKAQTVSLATGSPSSAVMANNPPSGIGAGLAEMIRGGSATAPRTEGTLAIPYRWEQVAMLSHGHNVPVRKVVWIYDGSLLASTADDGKVHLWRQEFNGNYYEYSETEPA